MRLVVVLAISCTPPLRPPVAPGECPDSPWVLTRQTATCADTRGGVSGYTQHTILDGPRRGEVLIHPYGEGGSPVTYANFGVVRAKFAPLPTASGTSCDALGGAPPPVAAGSIVDGQAFAREHDARAAFRAKRCQPR